MVVGAFAQTETKEPTDKPMQPGQTKLPSDQPTLASPAAATTSAATAPTGQPSAEDMQKMMAQMMEFSKVNENHKLLGELAGTWNYTVKFWMAPGAPPQESKGTAVRKPMWDGRFYTLDVSGKMEMPGADGKMRSMDFKGHAMEGYDNVKKKFVGTWMDNMGTGFMTSEGTYDAATKTFTHNAEYEETPGAKKQMREVLKVIDKDHHTFEMYENQGGQEAKTMEIKYTRAKK